MPGTPQCFICTKFATVESCVLLRNKVSGIRRWFHRKEFKPECWEYLNLAQWEEVDSSLGETTIEEERKLAGLEER